nr:sigma-70 family RNA polymerase sigma factor [Paenibacillus prosopidis]
MEQDVRLARQGDREAFARLIKNMELNLYGVARSIVKRDEDCADAIQEAILKAYIGLHALKEPTYFKTWMFRILINECNKILKRQKANMLVEELPTVSSSVSEYETVDLKEAVDRLDETLRTVIILYYFEDMSLKQISEILETSEGAVKTRLHRARQTLARWLENSTERKIGYEPC